MENNIEFQILNTDGCRGVQNTQASVQLINKHDGFVGLWRQLCRGDEPMLDFSSRSIIAVTQSARPNAGYGIEVFAVKKQDNGILVELKEITPKPDFDYAQVITYPIAIVSIPKSNASVSTRFVAD